jgi:hypothetical protein
MVVRSLGLFGLPGAGKSTTSKLIQRLSEDNGWEVVVLKLAEPLYDIQSYIYTLCHQPLPSRYTQDGVLLNFLGSHLRHIDPQVLLRHFRARYEKCLVEDTNSTYKLIICDDVRQPDVGLLRDLGFLLVKIEASPELCRSRRSMRGDTTLGSDLHPSEAGLETIIPNKVLENNGSLEQLMDSIRDLLHVLVKEVKL